MPWLSDIRLMPWLPCQARHVGNMMLLQRAALMLLGRLVRRHCMPKASCGGCDSLAQGLQHHKLSSLQKGFVIER